MFEGLSMKKIALISLFIILLWFAVAGLAAYLEVGYLSLSIYRD